MRTLSKLGQVLGKDQTPLQQESTHLVDERRSSCNQTIAHSVQRLQIQLLVGLDRHESHVLTIHRLWGNFFFSSTLPLSSRATR